MKQAYKANSGAWNSLTIWLHWVAAALIIAAFAIGWSAEYLAGRDAQPLLHEIHFSLGLLVLIVTVVRLGWRFAGPRPSLPGSTFERRAASDVHILLYLTTISAIVSGLVNFLFLGPVRVFGFVTVPRLFDPDADEWLRALAWHVHRYSWWVLGGLVLLHIAAALFHHFVRRDGVLRDFLPRRR